METGKLNDTIRELREYKRLKEEAEAQITALQAVVTEQMAAQNVDTLSGPDWKVTYKAVTSKRFDSKAFKADHADLYAVYVKPSVSRRFLLT